MECRISSLLHLNLMISQKYILLVKTILLKMEIIAGDVPKYHNLWQRNSVNDPWENPLVLVSSVVEDYWSSKASVTSQCWHLNNRDIDSLWLEMQSPSNFFCQQESYNELGAPDQILFSVSNSCISRNNQKTFVDALGEKVWFHRKAHLERNPRLVDSSVWNYTWSTQKLWKCLIS